MKPEDKKEKEVVILTDFSTCGHIFNEYHCEEVFYCKKCNSSIISPCDDYSKNNLANNIDERPDAQAHKKIVLQCCDCGYKDLLVKFLKRKPIEKMNWVNNI